MRYQSYFEKKIITVSSRYAILIIFVYTFVAVVGGLIGLPFYLKSQKLNDIESISPVLGKDYLLGDLIALRSNLDVWASRVGIRGQLLDSYQQVLWSSGQTPSGRLQFKIETPLIHSGNQIGHWQLYFDYASAIRQFVGTAIGFMLLSISVLALLLVIQRRAMSSVVKPLISLRQRVVSDAEKLGFGLSAPSDNDLADLQLWFTELSEAWRQQSELAQANVKMEALVRISSQVSHDIRLMLPGKSGRLDQAARCCVS